MNKQRRVFMLATATTVGMSALNLRAQDAKQPSMLAENDAQASALGYVADAAKADKKKFPQYAATQNCVTCQLFQGKPKEAAGPCTLFPNKQVSAKGWCSAWVKKAA